MPTDVSGMPLPTSILGLASSCEVTDVDRAARAVVARAVQRTGGYSCLCGAHLVTSALHDPTLRRALESAWTRFPDGAPVAWVQRRLGRPEARRVGGPDLMPRVVDLGRPSGISHFLLGSTPEVASSVERALRTRFPGALIAGRYSPPFTKTRSADGTAVAAIREAAPNIVWCALGAPKQELWMHRVSPALPNVLFLGVGAAFGFIADPTTRAPGWMRDAGLEWLHRLGSEPRRLAPRYLRANFEFTVRVAYELARRVRDR